MALKQEKVLMQEGYDIGIGVAMATGSPMALGAIGQVTPPQIGVGGSGSFTFRRVDSTQDLETELGIEAELSAGIGLFGASGSFDSSKKCKIQSSSLTVLVSAEERFAFQQMDSPELSPAASDAQANGKPLSDQFGEYFVRGIRTGGRFIGVVRIDTKSTQSKTDVNAALSGSYGAVINAEVKTKIRNAMSSANASVEARVIHDGGRVKTFPRSNDPVEALEQLYTAMDEWTATVRDEPKAYAVTLAPYIIALGPPPPNIAEIEHQRDVLIRCAKLRSQTMDKLNLIDYILDVNHMDEFEIFPPPEGPDLPALQAALAGDLDVIADAASFAINNVKEARDPVKFMREIRGVTDFELTALPTNLPEHKGPATIRVPTLTGLPPMVLRETMSCFSPPLQVLGGREPNIEKADTVEDCLNEVDSIIELPDGSVIQFGERFANFHSPEHARAMVEFCKSAAENHVTITIDPPEAFTSPEVDQDQAFCFAQSPSAETMISPGSEVIVRYKDLFT